jgi:hypothetical protein
MAKRHDRPSWIETAKRVIGLLARLASLIELVRKII